MDRVADGIYATRGYVSAYLIDGDQGVVLVDTGLPKKDGLIANGLSSIGRKLEDIVTIVLTHSHTDHMGSAAALKEASRSVVVAPSVDTPAIQGEVPIPSPPMMRGPLKLISKMLPTPTPVIVDHRISESYQGGLPDDFKAIDTPGHTPGHTSYLLDRQGGVMFVGDAAANKKGSITKGFPNAGGGPEIDTSIRHLGDFDFQTALFGHASPITSNAAEAFRNYA